MKKAEAVTKILRCYDDFIKVQDGEAHASKELQAAIAYAVLFIENMQAAIDQIHDEVDDAQNMADYVEYKLGYRSDYDDSAFSGISRADDILAAAVEAMHMQDVMECIYNNG